MVRKKLLAALFAIVILAAAWYCFSKLYQADRSRAGTMVQVEHRAQEERAWVQNPVWTDSPLMQNRAQEQEL
ncbi:MAG: hypothetical protein HFI39_08485 [Lachnospiraceae bacterium]|nr:hypothetical protein [Lachnospiraceae bacterium]